MGIRGIMTMMGFRKTPGSADMIIPQKSLLEEKYNQPLVVLTEEEKKKRKSIPLLSVGGKALSKHAHRSSEVTTVLDIYIQGYWGSDEGPELEKNKHAMDILTNILMNATWMNIHGLPHNEFILEVKYN